HFDVAVLFGLDLRARDEVDRLDVADIDSVNTDGGTGGEARDLRQERDEAIFGAEELGSGNVENTRRKDEQSDQHEEANPQFGPRELLTLRHLDTPPEPSPPAYSKITRETVLGKDPGCVTSRRAHLQSICRHFYRPGSGWPADGPRA